MVIELSGPCESRRMCWEGLGGRHSIGENVELSGTSHMITRCLVAAES